MSSISGRGVLSIQIPVIFPTAANSLALLKYSSVYTFVSCKKKERALSSSCRFPCTANKSIILCVLLVVLESSNDSTIAARMYSTR